MQKRTFRRIAPVLGLAGLLGTALTGCALINDVAKSSQDAWSVTYEISVDSKAPTTLSSIAYLDTPSRVKGQRTVKIDRAETRARGNGSSWTVESLVIAGASASVSAQPPTGTVATCRILLDGKREIAATTGAAGQPVLCKATAPKFDQ